MSASSRMHGSRFPAKLAFAAASLVMGFLFAETALRVAGWRPLVVFLVDAQEFLPVYFSFDAEIGVVRRKDVDIRFRFPERTSGEIRFVTNNHGFRRSFPTSRRKPEHLKRILVLGDSHVDGLVDNDENLTHLLEQRLNTGSERWEVLNAAVGSYCPYQNYLWYRREGRRFDPEIVLLALYLGNDLAEMMVSGRPRLVGDGGRFNEEPQDPEFENRFFGARRESPVADLVRWGARRSQFVAQLRGVWAGLRFRSETDPLALARRECLGCVGQALEQIHWFARSGGYPEALSVLDELLRRYLEDAEAEGVVLILAPLPSRLQVEPESDRARLEATAAILGLTAENLRMEARFYGDLVKMAERRGIVTVDLVQAFKRERSRSGKTFYYDLDWHMNERAHKVVAEEIFRYLLEKRLARRETVRS